jgi:hypothetical protein
MLNDPLGDQSPEVLAGDAETLQIARSPDAVTPKVIDELPAKRRRSS